VLRLLAAGESNAQIARRLGLSTHTIERHVANLYRKIDARGRADATAHALRNGPLDAYTAMVARHDASTAQKRYTDDYLQHGPLGPNVTREEFEAGNRGIVWKAIPDISIQLTAFLADGELVAYRGLGQGTHTGAELFGGAPAGWHVKFTETHIVRLHGDRVCEHWLQVDLLGLLNQLHA
jgi:predicted ester cyclase